MRQRPSSSRRRLPSAVLAVHTSRPARATSETSGPIRTGRAALPPARGRRTSAPRAVSATQAERESIASRAGVPPVAIGGPTGRPEESRTDTAPEVGIATHTRPPSETIPVGWPRTLKVDDAGTSGRWATMNAPPASATTAAAPSATRARLRPAAAGRAGALGGSGVAGGGIAPLSCRRGGGAILGGGRSASASERALGGGGAPSLFGLRGGGGLGGGGGGAGRWAVGSARRGGDSVTSGGTGGRSSGGASQCEAAPGRDALIRSRGSRGLSGSTATCSRWRVRARPAQSCRSGALTRGPPTLKQASSPPCRIVRTTRPRCKSTVRSTPDPLRYRRASAYGARSAFARHCTSAVRCRGCRADGRR